MHVAVVIVGFRNADDVGACVAALERSSHQDFSIHICENGGADAFADLSARIDGLAAGPLTIVSGQPNAASRGVVLAAGQPVYLYDAGANLGYAGGVNIGLAALAREGRYDAVWILNPDTEPAVDAMAALCARLRAGNYGIVGGRLILKGTGRVQLYGGRWRRWMARGYNIGLGAPADAVPDVGDIEHQLDYVSGACLLASRAYVESVGAFDERYFLYNEETDWCFRRGNWKLGYAHDAVIVHAHGTTIGSSSSRAQRSTLAVYLEERNKLLFTQKFYRAIFPIVTLATLVLTLQYAKAGAWRNFGTALAGWWAGVRGETGLPARFH